MLEVGCCRCTARVGVGHACIIKRGTYGKMLPTGIYGRWEGQVGKEGVLHRGPVGTRKRGRDGAEVGGQKKGKKQAAVLPRDQGGAGRPTQAWEGSRESPVRMENRARQRERPATPTQAPRSAPGISMKAGPKKGDKEG